jgi:hypothetical protein
VEKAVAKDFFQAREFVSGQKHYNRKKTPALEPENSFSTFFHVSQYKTHRNILVKNIFSRAQVVLHKSKPPF